jgi:hypothetical protein
MLLFAHINLTLPLEDPILKFLLILVIILAAPLLLNKLKIPYLLGLIIAGAVIGPHGLNLVLRDSSIILSGTAGLLYIMFLSGLDMDMSDFRRNSWRSAAKPAKDSKTCSARPLTAQACRQHSRPAAASATLPAVFAVCCCKYF